MLRFYRKIGLATVFGIFSFAAGAHAQVASGVAGNWYLKQIRCGGSESTKITDANLANHTYYSSMTIVNPGGGLPATGSRGWSYNSCNHTTVLSDMSSTSTSITVGQATSSCSGAGCGSAFGSCSVTGGSQTFLYSLNGPQSELTVSIACASGCDGYSPYDNPCGSGQSTSDITFKYQRMSTMAPEFSEENFENSTNSSEQDETLAPQASPLPY